MCYNEASEWPPQLLRELSQVIELAWTAQRPRPLFQHSRTNCSTCRIPGGTRVGPVGRLRIPQAVALLLKAQLTVTAFCFLLPDLVDKPLWALGIGCGRCLAHTLLFVFIVSIAFSTRKRVYGLFALLGGILHLLTDLGWFVPWFWPFVRYDFPQLEFADTFQWSEVGWLAIELSAVVLGVSVVSLVLWLSSWYTKRRRQGIRNYCRKTDETQGE